VLATGTIIPVTLTTGLSSKTALRLDTFNTTVDNSKPGYGNILNGATITGVVNDARPQMDKEPGTLDLGFTSIRLADGRTISISGALTSMDPSKVNVGQNGILTAKNTSKNNRLTYAGIGAGVGALVSLVANGKLKIEDILLGGLAGFGAATVLKSPEEVHDVDLSPGTPMGVMLTDSVTLSTPSQPDVDNAPKYHRMGDMGVKYYQFQGQPWAMDIATGERYPVPGYSPTPAPRKGKYYTYQGHPYFLDYNTGMRTQLD
jgi:hypothetical protein